MKRFFKIGFVIMLLMTVVSFGCEKAHAANDAGEIELKYIDYNNQVVKINPNGNSICYYSKDKSKWYELEYTLDDTKLYVMDISWVNANVDSKLYFKGDKNEKVVTVILPKKNTAFKCTFKKADGTFEFDEYEDSTEFQWRKNTDTNWQNVSLDESSVSYKNFLEEIEKLRFKGAKIVVRTPSVPGTSSVDTGARTSKEITVSVTKRNNAPSVTLNVTKLTVNTTDKMEYSLDGYNWKDCDKTMSVTDMLGNSQVGTIRIRTAATETQGYSKTATIIVPDREGAPSTVSHYTESKKLCLQISDASTNNAYEYVIVKPGDTFDENNIAWRTIRTNKVLKMASTSAPSGSLVFVRKKGVAENKSKGTPAVLPSYYTFFTVSY